MLGSSLNEKLSLSSGSYLSEHVFVLSMCHTETACRCYWFRDCQPGTERFPFPVVPNRCTDAEGNSAILKGAFAYWQGPFVVIQ